MNIPTIRCHGITKNGKRCRNRVRGRAFCNHHLSVSKSLAPKLESRPTLIDRAEKAAKIGGGIFALVKIIIKIIEFIAQHHHGRPFLRMREGKRMYFPHAQGIDWEKGRLLYIQCLNIVKETNELNEMDVWKQAHRRAELKEAVSMLSADFDKWFMSINSHIRLEVDKNWSEIME